MKSLALHCVSSVTFLLKVVVQVREPPISSVTHVDLVPQTVQLVTLTFCTQILLANTFRIYMRAKRIEMCE